MKSRLAKLIGLLTLLMLLWVAWPHFHPMWWRSEPAIEDDRMDSVIEGFIHRKGDTIKTREVVGWALYPNQELHHLVIVKTRDNSTYGVGLERSGERWAITGVTMKNDHKSLLGSYTSIEIRLYPRAWESVTGEVLTPSMLRELETPNH